MVMFFITLKSFYELKIFPEWEELLSKVTNK